jgi:acetoin utilization protein AcuB
MLVRTRMTPDPVAVSPDTSLAEALQLTRAHRVRHLPVLRDGVLAGIVSDRDIRLAMPSPLAVADDDRADFLARTRVGEVMTAEVIAIGPLETVEDAAKLMHRHRVGSLPVTDPAGRLLGIVTETDILRCFAELVGAQGPSTRLEVEMPERPGELARAVGIVGGDLRINLTGILIPPGQRGDRRCVVMHLATIDPREAIAALEAAGYRVGSPSLEADLRRGTAP